ncbi:hypothetical protein ACG02S_19300 [Roseateles sp. DC23W]|uniref:Uncharacterized protein n=1 Tax=Pelomonas dachongensis TaxID=3299029 RepID=A0ABW7ETX4_9BURK
MDTYFRELPGSMSLADQSLAIRGEESKAARFLNSKIWVNAQHQLSNLVEFEEINDAPATPLGKPKLSKTLAAGQTPQWTGQMIVQGKAEETVFLLRQ